MNKIIEPGFFVDPYPFYDRLRADPQPWHLSHDQGHYQRDFVLFSRYADAKEIFRQHNSISKEIRAIRPAAAATPFDLHVLHRDGQDHLRLRKLVADFFSLPAMDELAAMVTEVVDSVLASWRDLERVDLIADFAEPIPLLVVARLIGIPVADLPKLRTWGLSLAGEFDSLLVAERPASQWRDSALAFLDYTGSLLAADAAPADGSLLARLLAARAAGTISAEEAQGMLMFLLFAGHETTVNLLGNGMWLLLSHPQQLALLRQDPELVRSAIEEILRYESPEQRTSFRIATQSLTLGSYRLEPGQQFGVIIGAANRDEAEFPAADRFLIQRNPNRHLAFGSGLHNCLGKHLARLEAKIALNTLLSRYPRLELLSDTPDWRRNSFFRGLQTLPVQPSA